MLTIPFTDRLSDANRVTFTWLNFFREIKRLLEPLGEEKFFSLENNKAAATNLTGLSFSKASISVVFVDYLIQRITSTDEKVESGTFICTYLPTSNSWAISNTPSTSGITLTITTEGQIQYTSSNLGGTQSLSRIIVRPRYFGGKAASYSEFSGGGNR